jgi:CRISPR-associated protein Cas2
MPFYIAMYDMHKTRVAKMHKLLSRYMFWLQNSVFEGELTEKQYKLLMDEALKIMNTKEDSLVFFKVRSALHTERIIYGVAKPEFSNII